ncbi:unnamed protein product [Spirodela intermedia]|uniref:Uncharacterized protein n=1 Tax=Spirodela intermedia TaxID=51605 RepID=A0A7I8JIT5_SPIIN|nr:unnamed protein product [Spirodela intermedia]CAA6670067.1 unnamed protein product [Spirodela intermedia]
MAHWSCHYFASFIIDNHWLLLHHAWELFHAAANMGHLI